MDWNTAKYCTRILRRVGKTDEAMVDIIDSKYFLKKKTIHISIINNDTALHKHGDSLLLTRHQQDQLDHKALCVLNVKPNVRLNAD